jgi:hypothetical protein
MVVRTCPTCHGLGHLEITPAAPGGGQLVKVDIRAVLDDFKVGRGLRQVAKSHRISVETARVICNGTWAGFKKRTV